MFLLLILLQFLCDPTGCEFIYCGWYQEYFFFFLNGGCMYFFAFENLLVIASSNISVPIFYLIFWNSMCTLETLNLSYVFLDDSCKKCHCPFVQHSGQFAQYFLIKHNVSFQWLHSKLSNMLNLKIDNSTFYFIRF